MNPLFLLLGLLGLGATSYASDRLSSSGAASAEGKTAKVTSRPTDSDSIKDDDPVSDPETPVVADPVPEDTPDQGDVTDPGTGENPPPDTTNDTPTPAPDPVDDPADPPTPDPDPVDDPDPIPTPDPEPTPAPDPDPVDEPTGSTDGAPLPGEIPQASPQDTGGDGGEGQTIEISDGVVSVVSGRVATLEPAGDDIVSVSILSDVANGHVTVNPDNTFALVMTQSDFVGSQSFSYQATHADGSVTTHSVGLNVTPPQQLLGWGTGENHYMLATDENDDVIVEHGDEHHKVYVSASNSALSIQDIARMEGLADSAITGTWLANSAYGQSEDLALDENAGMLLWRTVTPRDSHTSNWLLLERGHEYNNLGRILERDTHGESENHPLHVGAWGEGERPEVTTEFYQYQESSSNVVIQDIHFSGGVFILYTENMIFDGIKVTEEEMAVQIADNLTIHNSDFIDVYSSAPSTGGSTWDLMAERTQGLYVGDVNSVLIEGSFFDHNGWADGYLYNASTAGAQPPSMFSHNMYINENTTDVTLRDTITMRASSQGALVRPGGFIENNVIMDNNVNMTTLGGEYRGSGPVGNYSLTLDNVITSGAHKEADTPIGGLSFGIRDYGRLTSLVDNIVTHMADPNNATEQAEKTTAHDALYSENPAYYDDTIIYNWTAADGRGTPDQNIEGLDTAILDQTTIQLFAEQLLGQPGATIADLANYLRAQAEGAFDDVVDAELIVRFFQEGFGIAPDIRGSAETLRFVPDDLGDGVRWDNRLNWDTDDLPGLFPSDDVDLGGNHVVYGSNTTIDELDLGPGGALNVYGGRLDATGGLSGEGGDLNIEGAGQAWIGGSDGSDNDINVDGGRFVNTDTMFGVDLTATGGQTVLATDGAEFEVSDSKTLAIFDAAAEVGFDGDDGGIALLDLDDGATLAFSAQSGDLGTIEEFRTGAMGDTTDVQSGIDLGNSTLSIDLSGLTGGTTNFTLMDADEIVGVFSDALIDNLGARNANVVIDYDNDTVTLQLSAGNGAISIDTVGEESAVTSGEEALWNALTAGQGVITEEAPAMMAEDDMADAA